MRSWSFRGTCTAVLGVVLFAAALPRLRHKWRPAVPEPSDLGQTLRGIPDRKLDASEVEVLQRDGVVLLRGVLGGNRSLVEQLRDMIAKHANMPFEETILNQRSWLYNGGTRALIRDAPLGDIARSAMGLSQMPWSTVVATEAPIWSWPARIAPSRNAWHTDSRAFKDPVMSIWIPLTDAPESLEFLLGSHLVRDAMEDLCAHQVKGGKLGFKEYDNKCVDNFTASTSSPAMKTWAPDLVGGDAFVFNGDLLHRGIRQTYHRLAISFRFNPVDDIRKLGLGCHFMHPALVPRSNDRHLGCAPWALLPGLARLSPWLPPQLAWLIKYF